MLGRVLVCGGDIEWAMCDVFFSPLPRTVARREGDAVGVESEALPLEGTEGTGSELVFWV